MNQTSLLPDIEAPPEMFIVVGTSLSQDVKSTRSYCKAMLKTVCEKNGTNVWLNIQPPPSDLKDYFTHVCCQTSDEFVKNLNGNQIQPDSALTKNFEYFKELFNTMKGIINHPNK